MYLYIIIKKFSEVAARVLSPGNVGLQLTARVGRRRMRIQHADTMMFTGNRKRSCSNNSQKRQTDNRSRSNHHSEVISMPCTITLIILLHNTPNRDYLYYVIIIISRSHKVYIVCETINRYLFHLRSCFARVTRS